MSALFKNADATLAAAGLTSGCLMQVVLGEPQVEGQYLIKITFVKVVGDPNYEAEVLKDASGDVEMEGAEATGVTPKRRTDKDKAEPPFFTKE